MSEFNDPAEREEFMERLEIQNDRYERIKEQVPAEDFNDATARLIARNEI